MRKNSANLVAIVGCHRSMVTVTTVSGSLLLYVSKGITVFVNWRAAFIAKIKIEENEIMSQFKTRYLLKETIN